ncbi:MAG TPA: lysophospholipid acyltransferase family protein [Tepidisphaeraceae bacterium]|nr:lysophospholipid acyltransferase family protein [Tepidisphaeraceae bacterium]
MEEWKLQPARDHGLPLGKRLRSVQRESGLVPWMIHIGCWSIVHVSLRVFHRLRIEGKELIPATGSFVLVANHSSHLDALVLACCLPARLRASVYPIAAGDTFFSKPITAAMSAVFINALPMWRRSAVSHSLADLRSRLEAERCAYIIFPEGTRSRDGAMAPFKAGLGMLLAGTAIPAVPCRLWGTFEALPPGRRWPRRHPIRLKIGPPIAFQAMSNDRAGWNAIALQTESAIVAMA